MATWILVVALAGSVTLAAALAVALVVMRRRGPRVDDAMATARTALREVVSEQTLAHADEIRRILARERADLVSGMAAEERANAERRRAEFAEREREYGESLFGRLADVESRLDERVRGFVDDLDRAQRHLEAQVRRLEQRLGQAITDVEARIESEATELGSTADEQKRVIHRLRDELERAAGQAVTEALDELEQHTTERRRAVGEITDKLRARETAMAESVEKAETDVRARLDVVLVEWERRQSDRLTRVTEREIERHVQVASVAFDERMRDLREDALTQLRRELDRAIEALVQTELVRRLEN